jgi:monoamine oxidase
MINRKEFLRKSAWLGLGLPFASSALLSACKLSPSPALPDLKKLKGKILIIGAGAAGMSAGYLLRQAGVPFEILEASDHYGGRIKKLAGWADFPIDLGAEWIHREPQILNHLLGRPEGELPLRVMDYQPQEIETWHHEKRSSHRLASNWYHEWKFKAST